MKKITKKINTKKIMTMAIGTLMLFATISGASANNSEQKIVTSNIQLEPTSFAIDTEANSSWIEAQNMYISSEEYINSSWIKISSEEEK
jgi:hypothetical protein